MFQTPGKARGKENCFRIPRTGRISLLTKAGAPLIGRFNGAEILFEVLDSHGEFSRVARFSLSLSLNTCKFVFFFPERCLYKCLDSEGPPSPPRRCVYQKAFAFLSLAKK